MGHGAAIIGIDPGTKCGWAIRGKVINGRRSWTSGTWDLSPHRHEGGGMRYVRLRNYIGTLLWTLSLEHIRDAAKHARTDAPWCLLFYEEVRRHLGVDAAHIYGGIIAVIQEECESMGVPYRATPVKTVKRLATGRGNASKEEVLKATIRRWPDFRGDDNEADARWIALAGLAEIGGE